MDFKANSASPHAQAEVSFVRGGPFYRAQQALGLVRPDKWNVGRRIAVLIAIGWLPLLLITVLANPRNLPSFLTTYRIHARMLMAVPALLLGEIFMESRFRAVLAHIRRAGLLEAPDMAYMDGVIARLVRLRDAYLPEFVVLVLLIVHIALSYRRLVALDPAPWIGQWTGADFRLSAAGWYAVLVSAPFFQFLLGLGLWKWLLWTFFAFKLSRRNLKLIATHPDGPSDFRSDGIAKKMPAC